MLERVMRRAEALAERRRLAAIEDVAARAREAVPAGVGVETAADGVALTGRGLRRRFATDPALRWMRLR